MCAEVVLILRWLSSEVLLYLVSLDHRQPRLDVRESLGCGQDCLSFTLLLEVSVGTSILSEWGGVHETLWQENKTRGINLKLMFHVIKVHEMFYSYMYAQTC